MKSGHAADVLPPPPLTHLYGPAVRRKRPSSSWRRTVLHQCIRPLLGGFWGPGHHGYQRGCGLISGSASWAIRVTSVRMRREDRSSISFLVLSQTSAGKAFQLFVLNHAVWILLASKVRPWARTLQAMRASLLASAMARTL